MLFFQTFFSWFYMFAVQFWKLKKWFYGVGLILFGCTRTYKYSMINETFGRSIITVLKSSNDVINFGVLYIPLGRMSLNIIKILSIVLNCKKGGWLLLSCFFYFARENSVYWLKMKFKACRIRCKKKFGANVNEFAASEAANWAGSQESRG